MTEKDKVEENPEKVYEALFEEWSEGRNGESNVTKN
jgi:hypothetical protein